MILIDPVDQNGQRRTWVRPFPEAERHIASFWSGVGDEEHGTCPGRVLEGQNKHAGTRVVLMLHHRNSSITSSGEELECSMDWLYDATKTNWETSKSVS